MVKINLNSFLESVFLILIFSTLIWAGCSVLWDHELSHNFPYGYLASDTFQHQVRAESIKEMGNYRNEAPYIVAGFKDVVGYYPPLFYHLGVIFSYVSGLETYDGAYFLVFFFAAIAAMIMYLIIRDFSKKIAILSLPFAVLIFSKGLYAGFTWGHWPSIVAQFFLVALFWAVMRHELEGSSYILGIVFAGSILSHTSEAIFGFIFIVIYSGYLVATKQLHMRYIKTISMGALIAGVICSYYLIIFQQTWAKLQPFEFSISKEFGGTLSFFMKDFGFILIGLMALGVIISLAFSGKKLHASFAAGLVMLLIGYSNYVGFGNRAFQARFFWPIYLSVFFGMGIYYIIKKITAKFYFYVAVALVFLLLFNAPIISAIPSTSRFTTPGMMDPYHWETLMWLKDNTPKDSKLYFFYGDIYYQDALLRNAEREHYLIARDDFIGSLQNKTIKRSYSTRAASDSGAGFAYRKGFFSYGMHINEGWVRTKQMDLCNFNYYIFDKASLQPVLAQYNMIIANELLKKEWVKVVYGNNYVVVLENKKPGEDCINETRFD